MAITKRKWKNGFTYKVEVWHKGKRVTASTFDTKAKAKVFEADVKSKLARGIWRDTSEGESTTIRESLERYLREITPGKKGAVQETIRIKRLMKHQLARLTLVSIRSSDIAKYRDERAADGLAASSIRLELAILSNLFTVAAREWSIEGVTNPVLNVKKPSQVGNSRDRRLVGDEEQRLIAACRQYNNCYLAPMVQFAIETAMRKSEILSMEWCNVDLKKRIAKLQDTKNGEARIVPLSSRAITVLQNIPHAITGRVFDTSSYATRKGFIVACKKAGIEGLRFHDLRHEATSRLFELGLNPMQVAAITGHKTLQMLKRYTHLKAEDLAEMMG